MSGRITHRWRQGAVVGYITQKGQRAPMLSWVRLGKGLYPKGATGGPVAALISQSLVLSTPPLGYSSAPPAALPGVVIGD